MKPTSQMTLDVYFRQCVGIDISKDKYHFREMKAKQSGVSMTMTVTKIKFGVSDDIFKFDPKNYPNAVIVRK